MAVVAGVTTTHRVSLGNARAVVGQAMAQGGRTYCTITTGLRSVEGLFVTPFSKIGENQKESYNPNNATSTITIGTRLPASDPIQVIIQPTGVSVNWMAIGY